MEFKCKHCRLSIRSIDSAQKTHQFDCPICNKSHKRVSDLKTHLSSDHVTYMQIGDQELQPLQEPPQTVGCDLNETVEIIGSANETAAKRQRIEENYNETSNSRQYKSQEKAMELHLNLMAKTYISNKNATETFNLFKNFMAETLDHFEQNFKSSKTLEEATSSFGVLAFEMNRSLELVDTEQKLLTTARNRELLFEPKKFVIQQKTIQNIAEIEEEDYFGTIMPIREQITKFLELPEVYKNIMKTQNELMNNKYTNLVSGSVWSNILKSYEEKNVIPIALYCDEFNPDKDTSPHAPDSKLNAFYYSFPTLPDYTATNIRNIFIALLYKSKDMDYKEIASHGMDPALHSILEELIPLGREGIHLKVDGVEKHVYVVAPQFFGDNAALNTVLGFTRSFSGNYMCRVCMIHKAQMQCSTQVSDELIRNEQNYNDCLAGSSTHERKGVKYDCVLNTLDYFTVYTNISVDIMHDVFLGVLKYDLIVILTHYTKITKVFTLKQFNEAKDNFDYGKKSAGDRTAPVLDSHLSGDSPKIHMAAKEMWTLMENLPLILWNLVPSYKTCEVFKFVCITTKLIDAVTRREYTEEDIAEMDDTIKEHHLLYLTIFDRPGYETHLTFKFHVMLHYPLYIRSFGPLRNGMTFKHESKHQQLKRYSRQCFSRVNLSYSLCKKFCLEFSNYISTKPNLFIELKNATIIKNPGYISAMDNITYCSKIEYKGFVFENGDVVRKNETMYLVKGIAVMFEESKAYVYCQEIEAIFQRDLNFFELKNVLNSFCELEISTITSRPVNIHNVNNKQFFFF